MVSRFATVSEFTPTSNMTLRDQILGVAGADVVVTTHGAHAITAAMFLPQGAVLLEVFPWGFFYDSNQFLARSCQVGTIAVNMPLTRAGAAVIHNATALHMTTDADGVLRDASSAEPVPPDQRLHADTMTFHQRLVLRNLSGNWSVPRLRNALAVALDSVAAHVAAGSDAPNVVAPVTRVRASSGRRGAETGTLWLGPTAQVVADSRDALRADKADSRADNLWPVCHDTCDAA